MRYQLRRSLLVQPLLVLLGGATAGRSYAEFDGRRLHVRFGWFFDNWIELADVESVQRSRWPWYGGLGLRSNLAGLVAPVGSYGGIVEIKLKRKVRTQAILPFIRLSCNQLFLSLEQPDEFVSELRSRLPLEA